MTILFISDLHLSPERPDISALFLEFLQGQARTAETLYVLGDLFEVWLGDDAVHPAYQPVMAGFRSLVQHGTPVFVMHGNRDFLMGEGFEQMSACKLINDPMLIDLLGEPTLLMHGDTLCTDDVEYQQFRAQVRDPHMQQQFLALPIDQRIAVARQYRDASQERIQLKSENIMDVNQNAVSAAMREHRVHRLIHGHTHRPAVHDFILDDAPARRTVLGDWYEQGSALVCNSSGCRLQSFSN